MKARKGFTLVEILIVVVILGILAAIVIPQFTSASTEAKESSLVSNLQAVRSQIQLYKIQHLDNWPVDSGATGADFIAQLTEKTNQARTLESAGATGRLYGPYMQSLPENPFSTRDASTELVRVDGAAAGADTHHWRFDTSTGLFQADDAGTNELVDPAKAHVDF